MLVMPEENDELVDEDVGFGGTQAGHRVVDTKLPVLKLVFIAFPDRRAWMFDRPPSTWTPATKLGESLDCQPIERLPVPPV
jgi:hypothetical protein